MRFHKYHALGNDYLVLDAADRSEPYSVRDCVLICHRNFGLGSDGILHGPLPSKRAQFGLRIYNPDGSEAEKSGNGLRIFAKYLFDTGRVTSKPFTVEVQGGVVTCTVAPGGRQIEVEMGRVSFASDRIPVNLPGPACEALRKPIVVAGESLEFSAATVGNPHAVFLVKEANAATARRLGPHIENHPLFPNRTNVQFLQVLDRANIRIEIWERGAGYTLASGSSSSAAAAVARRLGLVDADVTVHMPGGRIGIRISDDFEIHMTGPATRVGTYDFDESALKEELPD